MKEIIKHAVVKSENGMIFLGKSHADCFYQAQNVGMRLSKKADDQGFFTNKGRYVDRKEAAQIAVDAGQVDNKVNILFSELLWSKTDNGKYEYNSVIGYYEDDEKLTEKCSKCGSYDFLIVRDMTSRRMCSCGNSWECPN